MSRSLLLSVLLHGLVAGVVGRLFVSSDSMNMSDGEVYLMAPRGEALQDEVKRPKSKTQARVQRQRVSSDDPDAVSEMKKAAAVTSESGSDLDQSTASRPAPEGVSHGAEVDATQRYAYELRMALDRKKNYPSLAKRLRQEGRVLIRFKLRQDGSVIEAAVVQSTAHEVLNEAARKLIERIDGLKPFPDEIRKAAWEFVVPIEYKL